MDLEVKKDLTSNWFKMLQESFCRNIIDLENNKPNLSQQPGKKILKRMKEVENLES